MTHRKMQALFVSILAFGGCGVAILGLFVPVVLCLILGALLALVFPAIAFWKFAIALYLIWFIVTLVKR